jgi:hypothetical protein
MHDVTKVTLMLAAEMVGFPGELVYMVTSLESPVSEKLLAEMKDMGRTESESTLAYKWALEQGKLQN